MCVKLSDGIPLHVIFHLHALHRGRDFSVAHQLLEHLHLAAAPDELGGEGFVPDVVVDSRLDAELLADGRERPVGVLVAVVIEARQAFL